MKALRQRRDKIRKEKVTYSRESVGFSKDRESLVCTPAWKKEDRKSHISGREMQATCALVPCVGALSTHVHSTNTWSINVHAHISF